MCSCEDISATHRQRMKRKIREEIKSLEIKKAAAQSLELRRELSALISFFKEQEAL
ncbi:hypothetical protein [Roseibium polysiphoniae]|uniref:hypothetical protein n=1 Tax=Roseibium polysiphoniae TaxID=2571221 RepID=UPI003297BEE3